MFLSLSFYVFVLKSEHDDSKQAEEVAPKKKKKIKKKRVVFVFMFIGVFVAKVFRAGGFG